MPRSIKVLLKFDTFYLHLFEVPVLYRRLMDWVLSSAGRASPLQGECRGFESLSTHQQSKLRSGSSAG